MADIKIISMGPGGEKHLTAEAKDALENAEILIGAEKFRSIYGEKVLVPEKLISGTIDMIKENLGKSAAVLVTGDAGFFSLSKSVVKEFGRDTVTIIAGVSVVQLAFARLCEPWQDAQFISVHGRDKNIHINNDKFLILCDDKTTAKDISGELLNMAETHDIYAMEELGMENENIVQITSAGDLSKINGSSLGVVAGIRR